MLSIYIYAGGSEKGVAKIRLSNIGNLFAGCLGRVKRRFQIECDIEITGLTDRPSIQKLARQGIPWLPGRMGWERVRVTLWGGFFPLGYE